MILIFVICKGWFFFYSVVFFGDVNLIKEFFVKRSRDEEDIFKILVELVIFLYNCEVLELFREEKIIDSFMSLLRLVELSLLLFFLFIDVYFVEVIISNKDVL